MKNKLINLKEKYPTLISLIIINCVIISLTYKTYPYIYFLQFIIIGLSIMFSFCFYKHYLIDLNPEKKTFYLSQFKIEKKFIIIYIIILCITLYRDISLLN